MKVYVAGILGKTPLVVAEDFEQAAMEICRFVFFQATEVVWTCAYLDCDTSEPKPLMRWTAPFSDGVVYIESYTVTPRANL